MNLVDLYENELSYGERVFNFVSKYMSDPDDVCIINPDKSLDIDIDIYFQDFADYRQLPFKLHRVNGTFSISKSEELDTLYNCPDIVIGSFEISDTSIKSLEFMPKLIRGRFHLKNNKLLIDPYEYRYALFSKIDGLILTDNSKIRDILHHYQNNPSQAHIAMDKLMELGESMGFNYV